MLRPESIISKPQIAVEHKRLKPTSCKNTGVIKSFKSALFLLKCGSCEDFEIWWFGLSPTKTSPKNALLSNSFVLLIKMSWLSWKSLIITQGLEKGLAKICTTLELCLLCCESNHSIISPVALISAIISGASPHIEFAAALLWGMFGIGFGRRRSRMKYRTTTVPSRKHPMLEKEAGRSE